MLLVDGFIKSKKLLDELKKEEYWGNIPSSNWWDGWWKIKPRNIWETTIEIIWKNIIRPEDKICGFEYWANKHTENSELKWHHDKDEKLIKEKNQMSYPTVGMVYYVELKNLDGGYLEIAPDENVDNKGNFKKIYTYDDHTERIRPLENRLIIWNPSKLHCVSKIHKGTRKAFIANGWRKKPLTFDKSENVDTSCQPVNWVRKNQPFNI